jgi:3-oxoacyl-[acyl-carrier protein] reductase
MQHLRGLLISGTRKGIGRALAAHYLELGYRVIGCSRKPSELEHENYEHHCLDVRDEAAVRRLMEHVRAGPATLVGLINNAGIAGMNHALLTPMSAVRDILETNVVGTFLFCREAAKLLRFAPHARIVNFSTVAVPLNLEGEAIYAASKAAVETLTRIFARELAPLGITCNAVGPSPIETDLIGGLSREKIDRLLSSLAIHRLAAPADVANVVDFFLRPESDFVTGQVIYLGGIA